MQPSGAARRSRRKDRVRGDRVWGRGRADCHPRKGGEAETSIMGAKIDADDTGGDADGESDVDRDGDVVDADSDAHGNARPRPRLVPRWWPKLPKRMQIQN